MYVCGKGYVSVCGRGSMFVCTYDDGKGSMFVCTFIVPFSDVDLWSREEGILSECLFCCCRNEGYIPSNYVKKAGLDSEE